MRAKNACKIREQPSNEHLANHRVAPYDLALHALGEETQMVDLDELKSKFLNMEFASRDLQIDADNLVASATASGEARAEFIDPAHPDFQATPAYLCSISSGRHLPIDFPSLGGIPMDGGKPWSDSHRCAPASHCRSKPTCMIFTTRKADRAA